MNKGAARADIYIYVLRVIYTHIYIIKNLIPNSHLSSKCRFANRFSRAVKIEVSRARREIYYLKRAIYVYIKRITVIESINNFRGNLGICFSRCLISLIANDEESTLSLFKPVTNSYENRNVLFLMGTRRYVTRA